MSASECVVANVGGVGGIACFGAGDNGVCDGEEIVDLEASNALDVLCVDVDFGSNAAEMTEASVGIGTFNAFVTDSSDDDSERSSDTLDW